MATVSIKNSDEIKIDLWTLEDWNESQAHECYEWERVDIVSEKEARAKALKIDKMGDDTKIGLYTPHFFEWTGSLNDYIGRELVGSDYAIAAVFPKKRFKKNTGAYVALMCVSTWGF